MPWRWEDDVSRAGWLEQAVVRGGYSVGTIVPPRFERCARLFHPIRVPDGRELPWAELARANGRVVHPGMQLRAIVRRSHVPQDGPRAPHHEDSAGCLPVAERTVLVEHLAPATTTPEGCWFCVWEGWGDLDPPGTTARVRLPRRDHLLARGPLEQALEPMGDGTRNQSPTAWWPDDRAWFVASEIDYGWTYVAGTSQLVERVLGDPRLEAVEVGFDDVHTFDSDALNPIDLA